MTSHPLKRRLADRIREALRLKTASLGQSPVVQAVKAPPCPCCATARPIAASTDPMLAAVESDPYWTHEGDV